jgi:hypothetical protein
MVFQLKTHLKVRFSSISSFRLLARCERSKTETIILASVFQQYSFTLAMLTLIILHFPAIKNMSLEGRIMKNRVEEWWDRKRLLGIGVL